MRIVSVLVFAFATHLAASVPCVGQTASSEDAQMEADGCWKGSRATDCLKYLSPTLSEATPVQSGTLIQSPGTVRGRFVRASFITGCFVNDSTFVCTATAPSLAGRILIVAPTFKDAEKRRSIEERCGSLAEAARCRMDIAFTVRGYRTDLSGRTRVIESDAIFGY